MQSGIYIELAGHRTWLKWHRGRRRAGDTAFTATRILEAMREGAHVEVDLRAHRDGGFAILHDRNVMRETTGRGFVADLSADALRQLLLRDEAGRATPHPVMLLDDLARLLARETLHPDALLQLDFKDDAAALDDGSIGHFAATLAPFATNLTLSATDAAAVALLSQALPALQTGYDPCSDDALEALALGKDYAGFVDEAIATAPGAAMIYLHYPVILAARDAGFDMVAAFHARGFAIDAWTIEAISDTSLGDVQQLLDCKVDQITTDDPEGLEARLVDWWAAA